MLNTNLKISLLVILPDICTDHALVILISNRLLLLRKWKSWYSCFSQLHLRIHCQIRSLVLHSHLLWSCLQTKSLFVRVHSFAVSNILLKNSKTCQHINNSILISLESVSCFKICRDREREWRSPCRCETKTLVTYKTLCVFTLLHMGLCCPLSSACLQNLKIYVLL